MTEVFRLAQHLKIINFCFVVLVCTDPEPSSLSAISIVAAVIVVIGGVAALLLLMFCYRR